MEMEMGIGEKLEMIVEMIKSSDAGGDRGDWR
jgi:hypothetical protein